MWSVASIVLVLAFIVGERSLPSAPDEWLGFLFFPLGASVGMLLGWWNERIGGIITVGSLGVFYLLHFTTAGAFPRGWAWLVFAAPGFLFLLTWFLSRRETPTAV